MSLTKNPTPVHIHIKAFILQACCSLVRWPTLELTDKLPNLLADRLKCVMCELNTTHLMGLEVVAMCRTFHCGQQVILYDLFALLTYLPASRTYTLKPLLGLTNGFAGKLLNTTHTVHIWISYQGSKVSYFINDGSPHLDFGEVGDDEQVLS